jgi:alkaline phosphatase
MKYHLLPLSLFITTSIFAQNVPSSLLSTTSVTIVEKVISDVQAAPMKKSKKPKNVIFMVGDGMGVSQIYAGMIASKGTLNLEQIKHIGFHKNQSANNLVTDSAAGATAFSTGNKAKNGGIGVDASDVPAETILEIAEKNGLSTGLVTTSSLTDATPSAFIAHQPKRSMSEEIAADYLKTDVDIFIGGGKKSFTKRSDGLNLVDSLQKRNYQIVHTAEEIQAIKSGKIAGFTAEEDPIRISQGRGNLLSVSANKAIDLLGKNKKGFFLMIEGAQIDWGGHANDTDYIVNEMLDFDKVIGEVLQYAEKDGNTLVVITADHETGGFAINGGNSKTGEVKGAFTTKSHTGVMIPVFAFGPGAEEFTGFYENTAIFHKIKKAFGFK